MNKCRFAATMVVWFLLSSVARASALQEPCPIDWRAVPLVEAVRELAKRLDTPYILDPSVGDEMLHRPVRLAARHLSGREAFRWTVRMAGLDAVLVEGAVMIARPDRLPAAWRLAREIGGGATASAERQSGGSVGPAGDPRWQAALARKAGLNWVDAPLSRVTKDVSEQFGIDVVFHPAIQDEQPLVRLEGDNLDLAAVRRGLEEQLKAVSEYDDGVIWIEPRALSASRPAGPTAGPHQAALAFGDGISVLSRPVDVTLSGRSADEWGETLGRVTGLKCRVEAVAESRFTPFSARGTLAEVLEAGRLLEGWDWKISSPTESKDPFLLIRASGSGRSVP